MIAPPSFDTLKIAQDLKHAGFTEQQAEALTDAIKAAFTDTVATKADLQTVETTLKADLQTLRGEVQTVGTTLKADLRAVGARMEAMEARLNAQMAEGFEAVAEQFQGLYKQLWLGALGIVTAVVALVKLL